jgi:zinc transporter 1/2/3
MSLANAFSGGLFLAIALIHLLPETAHEYEHYLEHINEETHALQTLINSGSLQDSSGRKFEWTKPPIVSLHGDGHGAFPLPYLLAFIGYAFILLLDKVAFNHHDYLNTKMKKEDTAINERDSDYQKADNGNTLTPYILLVALGSHAFLEGMAVGLLTNKAPLYNLIISILIHKFAESMSITIAMQKAGMTPGMITRFALLFALTTPLGTVLGILVNDMSELANILFTSLAAGTFIYVACSELIVEEFENKHFKGLKYVSFLMGAGLVCSLMLF